MKCFLHGNNYSEIRRLHRSLTQRDESGIIFWHNNTNDAADIISKLSPEIIAEKNSSKFKEFYIKPLYLVDNNRMSFINSAIDKVESEFKNAEWEFLYFESGKNSTHPKNGKVMPIQYINSSILPIRVDTNKKEKIVCLFCIDDFEEKYLTRIVGLSRNLSHSLSARVIIYFPKYNQVEQEPIFNVTTQRVKFLFNKY